MNRVSIYRVTGITTVERGSGARSYISERVANMARLPDGSHWAKMPASLNISTKTLPVNALVKVSVKQIESEEALNHPGLGPGDISAIKKDSKEG